MVIVMSSDLHWTLYDVVGFPKEKKILAALPSIITVHTSLASEWLESCLEKVINRVILHSEYEEEVKKSAANLRGISLQKKVRQINEFHFIDLSRSSWSSWQWRY